MKKRYSDIEIVEGIKQQGKHKELILKWLCSNSSYINHSRIECRKFNITNTAEQQTIFFDCLLALCSVIEKGKYEVERARILTFWKGIHRNLCLPKSSNKNKSYEEMKEDHSKAVSQDHSFEILQILEAFRKIAPDCSKLLKLCAAGYQPRDIVEITDYKNANSVRVMKSGCIKRLKKFMSDDERG